MAQSPDDTANAMIANMKEKTGMTLEDWLALAKTSGEEKHGGVVKFLKSEHGLTHGYANLVAHKLLKSDAASAEGGGEALVAAQYAGPKAALIPIHDALIEAAQALGRDVEIAPKKTYVSLRRKKQFALIQPSTRTRLDLGLNFENEPSTERLEKSGSFNAMVSHRVRLEKPQDVDRDVKAWLKKAYDEA